ncbi:hypothetical protein N665_0399s0014 [Sinapis alba]|nr:hypothetical protein N665_0399s0014 [Sinapis alba]
MERENHEGPPYPIPERIFKAGEEPTGVRVTPYCFSVLRTKHKRPFAIRFSLREFALVTGLNCGKFPKRSKKRAKKHITEKPYWGELFGTLKEVPVSSVIRMLKKKTVTGCDMRLKYAYLALLSSVILPTTHTPRISQDHAEMIKDIEEFFAYPWGRISFDMLMSSIKERKEVSLSQNTIALKGFVLSLQLVMVEAVPALTEAVHDDSSSGSEDEFGEEEDNTDDDKGEKKSISPGHARDTDAAGKAIVRSIIFGGDKPVNATPDFEWSDDEEDHLVDNLMKLIDQGYPFSQSCFIGGVTKVEVIKLREEAKAEGIHRKNTKSKQGSSTQTLGGLDVEVVAAVVKDKVKEDFTRIESQLANIRESDQAFQTLVLSNLSQLLAKLEGVTEIISSLSKGELRQPTPCQDGPHQTVVQPHCTKDAGVHTNVDVPTIIQDAVNFVNQSSSSPDDGGNVRDGREVDGNGDPNVENAEFFCMVSNMFTITAQNLEPSLMFPKPSFSLGLTQEARVVDYEAANLNVVCGAKVGEDGNIDDIHPVTEEVALGCRKSKRQKLPPKSLLGHYECDKRFLNRARQAVADSNNPGGNIDYSAKFAILLDKMKTQFILNVYFTLLSANNIRLHALSSCIKADKWTLESSELYEMVDRSKPLSAKVIISHQFVVDRRWNAFLVCNLTKISCMQVVDVLISHISATFLGNSHPNHQSTCVFMDTQFVSQISKVYTKFSKVSKKESFRFPESVLDFGLNNTSFAEAERFYFPFNLDKKYWVGICVDISTWSIVVLDSNITIRSDYMMTKEIRPIAQMFPFFAKQVGKQVGCKDGKPFAIDRPRCIPQNNSLPDSAVSSILFIQAHAVAGADACKCITPDVLDTEVERLAVTLYEGNVGIL